METAVFPLKQMYFHHFNLRNFTANGNAATENGTMKILTYEATNYFCWIYFNT